MNLHTPSVYAAEASVSLEASTGRVWVYIGTALLAMTAEEARALAKQLQDAAGNGAAVVNIEGLQSANEDLVCEHVSAGKPA